MRNNALLPAATLLLFSSCASYHVRKGEQDMSLLAYSQAEQHFDKALKQGEDRRTLLLAGQAELKQEKVEEASVHYVAAEKLAPLEGDDAYAYGRLLMAQGKYTEAEPMFVRALQDRPEKSDIAELIGACQGYRSFYTDSLRYRVRPVPMQGISRAYSPVAHGDRLLFTGQKEATMAKQDPWSGQSFADLYLVTMDAQGNPGTPEPIKGTVNGPFHEGPAALADSGRTLYFTRSNYYGRKLIKDQKNISNLKLFRATLGEDGAWGNITEFAYNGESFSLGQPAVSKDGKTLFFTSDMPGGHGGKDLWYSRNLGTGWEPPVNMGPSINTIGDEMFPTVVGDALYFSSTGHNNMGGLDIFETHPEGEYWSEPQNMGYPVNSTRDDFGLWLDSTGTHGYFSSSRTGTDLIHELIIPTPEFTVSGTISNAQDGKPVPFALVTLQNLADLMNVQDTADANGNFSFKLDPNRVYNILVQSDSMLARSTMVSTVGLGISSDIRADIMLDPLELEKPIVVPNIYYDYDKWDIRPDAAVELNKLARTFMDNPHLVFELSSHTDCRGSDLYNLVLSDARAKSAVDYLLRQGVPHEQLIARGYGESMLVNGCHDGVECTEEEHQQNRRTEIKVVNAGVRK